MGKIKYNSMFLFDLKKIVVDNKFRFLLFQKN